MEVSPVAFYVVMYLILVCAFALYKKSRFAEKNALTFVILVSLFFFIIIGFRYKVGADWEGYKKLLDYYRLDYLVGASDPIFLLIMKISNLFPYTWSNQVMNLQFALIFVVCILTHFYRVERNLEGLIHFYLIGFPVIILLMGMGYLRQGPAAILVMMGYSSFRQKKLYPTLLFYSLALLMHKSAALFIALPIYLYLKPYFDKKKLLIYLLGFMASSVCIFMLIYWGPRYIDHSMTSSGALVRFIYVYVLLCALATLTGTW